MLREHWLCPCTGSAHGPSTDSSSTSSSLSLSAVSEVGSQRGKKSRRPQRFHKRVEVGVGIVGSNPTLPTTTSYRSFDGAAYERSGSFARIELRLVLPWYSPRIVLGFSSGSGLNVEPFSVCSS